MMTGNNSTDVVSVVDTQRTNMKWQQQQQLQQQQQQYYSNICENDLNLFSLQAQALDFEGMVKINDSGLGELANRVVKADPGLDNDWPDLERLGGLGYGFGKDLMNYVEADIKHRENIFQEKLSSVPGIESCKKRKADNSHNIKELSEEEETKDKKRLKGVAEEGESKITEQNSNEDKKKNKSNNNNNNRETSGDSSKDNSKSKVSESQKLDYIHVRARRGQATDSHSLAERVRREKISERMKYLQDLVPGCNKITGKAGMLDEIINYVQSLQRQVEFLSMKLAAVNPRLDFNIDNLFAKEAFPACTSNFPTIGVSPAMANPRYLQFNPLQQTVSCSTPDTALQRSISAPISIPETFLDSSCFSTILPSSTWEADLQNLYSMEFSQGRLTSFPSHQFTGSIEEGSLKMEM